MERPFDHLYQDCGTETKKKKPKTKKRWLLSKQYLQPLEEPESEADPGRCRDASSGDKLRCICRSAFCGMKEGLLTGVFLGGFYGIFKFLSGSSSAFFGSTGGGGNNTNKNERIASQNYGGGVRQDRKGSARSRRPDTRTYQSLGRRYSGSRSGNLSYQEKLSNYRTIEETVYGYTREAKPQNLYGASHFRNIDINYSKVPIRADKYFESLNSKDHEKRKYAYGKNREKVEIVGYAFIKTMGAFETESTGSKSVEYGSPKQSKSDFASKDEEAEEEEEEDEPPPSGKRKVSVESSGTIFSHISESLKSASTTEKSAPSQEKSSKTLKNREGGLTTKGEKSSVFHRSENMSEMDAIDDSSPQSKVGSDREAKDSGSKISQKVFSSIKGSHARSRSKQSVINETDEQKQKPSRITIVSPKQHSVDNSHAITAEESSSILIKSMEPDQSEISTRPTNELSQDSRLRAKDSNKSSKRQSKHSVRTSTIIESDISIPDTPQKTSKFSLHPKNSSRLKNNDSGSPVSTRRNSENLYPQHAPSYLVSADDVSNGYGSPSLIMSGEHQSEDETIHSKYSESLLSPDIESSRAELNDVGYTGSNISEFQMRSPFHTMSSSMSVTPTDHNRTEKESSWSMNPTQDSRAHTQETTSGAAEESGSLLKTPKQSRSVIFSESGRTVNRTDRSDQSRLSSVEPSEKSEYSSGKGSRRSRATDEHPYDSSHFSSEQVSRKSQVTDERLSEKSILSSERVSRKSHVTDEQPYESSLYSSEQVSRQSRIPVDQYSHRSNIGSQETSKTSHRGRMLKSSSSVMQDESPNTSRSSVAKSVHSQSRTQKASTDQEDAARFSIFSSVTDNTIVLCACNCALVLGILCTVISTTRASLKI